jgi:hypothetical protein
MSDIYDKPVVELRPGMTISAIKHAVYLALIRAEDHDLAREWLHSFKGWQYGGLDVLNRILNYVDVDVPHVTPPSVHQHGYAWEILS